MIFFGEDHDYDEIKENAKTCAYHIQNRLRVEYLNEIKITKKIIEELLEEYQFKTDEECLDEGICRDTWTDTLRRINSFLRI